ncbi:MAG TPA: NAD(P)H-dependent oxidoreductase [Gammaproteobacteria bacterium]|nr:NAD(P)H-dependent oxidoreductase [Gammaproteobacteria bacterium]HIK69905.1 NAD(P)H-dependent oxidoreductase [Pseudomonadales bacterium]
MSRFLTFSGSRRQGSFNTAVVKLVSRELSKLSTHVTDLSLNDFELPLYEQTIEKSDGLPDKAADLRDLFQHHDGLVIGCPEYNGILPPLLLNTLTWISRSPEGQPDLSLFQGKCVLVTSCSPGSLGGIRAAAHLKSFLSGVGCVIFPDMVIVANAFSAFREDGGLTDENLYRKLITTTRQFHQLTSNINA